VGVAGHPCDEVDLSCFPNTIEAPTTPLLIGVGYRGGHCEWFGAKHLVRSVNVLSYVRVAHDKNESAAIEISQDELPPSELNILSPAILNSEYETS
jgi:hypothetical protein